MAIGTMRVPTVFYAVDRFSSVVDRMTRRTSAFGATAQAAAMRTSRQFNNAGNAMLGAGIGLATGIGYAVNEAVKFEKAMANVDTTIDSTPGLIKAMGDSVLEMSKRVPVPLSQLTEALYDVVSAGIESKNAMYVLEQSSKLAVAGLGTSKEGVDVITSSLNAFNIKAEESANIANMVFKAVKYGKTTVSGLAESFGSSAALVKNSNVTLQEYLATTATLTTTGMTASRAQTQVASAVTALIKPSKAMQAILDSLGAKSIPEFIKKNGGLVNTMKIVGDRANKMGILTSKAFGRKEGFSAMLSLLGPLKNKYLEVMGDMVGGTDSMTQAFEKQQRTVSAGAQRMKNSLTVLAVKMGQEVIPRVNDFIDRLTPLVDNLTGWMNKNKGLASTLMNLTLALLILGTVAKVGAALFYGLAKVWQLITFVSETAAAATALYESVMVTAVVSGQGLTVVLFEMAAAFLAAAWPVLLIVGFLGLLTYAMFDSVSATDNMVGKHISALDKQNLAWQKSTKVQATELQRQQALMETHNPDKLAGARANLPIVQNILKRTKDAKISKQQEDAAAYAASKASFGSQLSSGSYDVNNVVAKPKNLAGKNQSHTQDLMNSLSKNGGILTVNLNDPGGSVKDVDDSQVEGIKVKTTSTKKPSRGGFYNN